MSTNCSLLTLEDVQLLAGDGLSPRSQPVQHGRTLASDPGPMTEPPPLPDVHNGSVPTARTRPGPLNGARRIGQHLSTPPLCQRLSALPPISPLAYTPLSLKVESILNILNGSPY